MDAISANFLLLLLLSSYLLVPFSDCGLWASFGHKSSRAIKTVKCRPSVSHGTFGGGGRVAAGMSVVDG